MEEERVPLHVVAFGEAGHLATNVGVDDLMAQLGRICRRLTIAAVAEPELWVTEYFGALGGADLLALREEAVGEAAATAHHVAGRAPCDVGVSHWAARTWGDALRLAMRERCDLAVLIGFPRRARDRRLIATAGVKSPEPLDGTLAAHSFWLS
jgi:hypothetical protein